MKFLIGAPLAVAGLLLLFFVLRWVLHRLVDRLVKRAESGTLSAKVGRLSLGAGRAKAPSPSELATATRRVQRAKAMGSLLKSVITGVLVAVFGTMVLAQVGVNIAPIIASAGIVGVALGFGAQSLVKDFLTGIFMILEDQYGVGDVVDLGEAIGTVEAVSLRVTRVRDVNGTVWYVRNGEIVRVGNKSQNWARSVLDVTVAYHEDLARVRRCSRTSPTTCGRTRTTRASSSSSPRCGASRSSASTASSSGWRSRPHPWSSGRWRVRCGSGSRPASTTRASRSRTRSG